MIHKHIRRKIFAVICSNGLGHFRRTLEVVYALSCIEPEIELNIVCEQWQHVRMRDWKVVRNLDYCCRVRWLHGVIDPGVQWSLDPSDYSDGRLCSWIQRLSDLDGFFDADLVLSDNLSGVLEFRSDSVLMGSFLWSDILSAAYPEIQAVTEFVTRERDLLKQHKPHMLCVADVVMPGVLNETRAVPLSWMRSTQDRPDVLQRRSAIHVCKVAILVGATVAAHTQACDTAGALLERGLHVALPKSIYEHFRGQSGVSIFCYENADFFECDLALCRPGLGSIHDCIFYGLPMVLAWESGNIEMMHNGKCVEHLGLGINLGSRFTPVEMADRVLEYIASGDLERVRKRMAETSMEGIGQASRWLRERLLQIH